MADEVTPHLLAEHSRVSSAGVSMPVPPTKIESWLEKCEERRIAEAAEFRSLLEQLSVEQVKTRQVLCDIQGISIGCQPQDENGSVHKIYSAPVDLVTANAAKRIDMSLPLCTESPNFRHDSVDSADVPLEKEVDRLAEELQDLSGQLRAAVGWDQVRIESTCEWKHLSAALMSSETLRGHAVRLTSSGVFQALVAGMVILNSASIAVAIDVDMRRALVHEEDHFLGRYFNIGFMVAFALEMVLRLYAERKYFFTRDLRMWNLFDLSLVLTSLVEVSFEGFNFSFLRILRVLRVIRMLRIIRMFRFFQELRLMTVSLASCLPSLMWAAVLMLMCMFLFGIFLLDGARDHVRSLSADDEDLDFFAKYYGGVPQILFTLILSISGGMDWYDLLEPLLAASVLYAIPFTLFVLFVMFGMLNILVGIFVQKSNELFHLDQELVMNEEMNQKSSYLNQIQELFKKIDTDLSNTLTWEELIANLQDERVMTYFALLQIDVSEAKGLFQLLDVNESGEVGIDEFIMGCMRLKGAAKSIDMATMMYENKKTAMKFNHHFSQTNKLLMEIMTMMSNGPTNPTQSRFR